MKTSFAIAAIITVGAGAAGAGATFAVQPYVGSDTEFEITNQALANSTLGNFGDYIGGGSGTGENAMTATAPTQRTAPMSKMMTNTTCKVAGGTNASGIAFGLDAVNVYSSISAGGTAACNGTADGTGTGLVYSGSFPVDGGLMNLPNWTEVLALLYGGLNKATGITDCNSTQRQNLVASWSNLFQNNPADGGSCSNSVSTCTTASMPKGSTNITIGGQLWHAFRRDDNSGTSDVFASLIGLGKQKDLNGVSTITANVSSSGVKGFGVTPYCNAMNWDTTAANETGSAHCALGANKQFLGPGGVPDPTAADGRHMRPPPGTWGDKTDTSSNSAGAAAFPTSYQDNDPIRRPCLGKGTFNSSFPMEEVCNMDGQLGVVLPIPPVDFVPKQNAGRNPFPTNACNGAFVSSNNFPVFKCGPAGQKGTGCADSDVLFGGGCQMPADTTGNTLCFNNKTTNNPQIHTNPTGDGRIFNLFLTDGANGYTTFAIPAVPVTLTFSGAFARIHAQVPLWDTANAATKGVPCQMQDATDQIGCLAQADPCSVGFAGDGAKTWGSRNPAGLGGPVASNIAGLRVNQIAPTTTTVQNGSYLLWRKIYFNASNGFDNLLGGGFGAELGLAQFESNTASITSILSQYDFFFLGAASPQGQDKPFCEDFNEQLLCDAGVANVNSCGHNNAIPGPDANAAIPGTADAGAFSPIPGDPSTDPNAATTSTVCGNGRVDPLEDCDNGLANGTSGNSCSVTCRFVFP